MPDLIAAGGAESEELRESMSALIIRLRRLLQDPNKTIWPDDVDLQQVLDDDHRYDWRYVILEFADTRQPGGALQYLDFYAPEAVGGNWESGVGLTDSQYRPVEAATANLIVGHWTFAQPVSGNRVFLSGRNYDLYGAAADLLEWDLAKNRGRRVDVTEAGGASIKRSQTNTTTDRLIAKYRARQRSGSVAASRSDVGC